ESYRTCGFQFYGHYALGLTELDEELETAEAATRGTVVHAMLEAAVAPLVRDGRVLDAANVDEAIARLRREGADIWHSAPQNYGFGRAALWWLQAGEAIEQLEALLQREAAASAGAGVQRVLGAEIELRGTLALADGPLQAMARVD